MVRLGVRGKMRDEKRNERCEVKGREVKAKCEVTNSA